MDEPARAVVKSRRHDRQKLHFPAENADGPKPLCLVATNDNPWRWRDLATLPPSHRDWCERCKDRAAGEWPRSTSALFDACPLCGTDLDGSLAGHLPECDG